MTHAQMINRFRSALEFATFRSPEIRDAVSNAIKELAADMEEVEFTLAIPTIQAFKQIDAAISDFENPNAAPVEIAPAEEIDRETPTEFDVGVEVDEVLRRPSVKDIEDTDDIE